MIKNGFPLKYIVHISLFVSAILICSGLSKFLLSGFGNTAIYDIEVESYEGFIYYARLFRPIRASSLNPRPSVLMSFGSHGSRSSGDHIAAELARRGFVVLIIEDFRSEPEFETENMIDAGYTYLATRTFTDHARIGLAAWADADEKSLQSVHYNDFVVHISEKDVITFIQERDTISYLIDVFHDGLDLPDDTEFLEISGIYTDLLRPVETSVRTLLLAILLFL